MRLRNLLKVNTHYTRSINLERDSEEDSSVCTYIPTHRAVQTLRRVVDTFNTKEAPRAWALVGPYGSGKSAFGLFLSQLLGNPGSATWQHAMNVLKRADESLAKKIAQELTGTDGYCCINLTGSPEALSKRLTKAMLTSAQVFFGKKQEPLPEILKQLQAVSESDFVTTSEVTELISELQKAVHRAQGVGILIIIDELGKFLEFEAKNRDANDVFLLQAIAESAFKPNLIPLHFVVLLHQAFEQYFQRFGEKLKNEWKKVQGRFENVPFLESTEQTLQILSASLISNFDNDVIVRKSTQCDHIVKSLSLVNALPLGMEVSTAHKLFGSCYPLHPLTLLLLPTLCQKVAQNERTLFTYLGSKEPYGFLETLNHLEITDEELPWIMPWEIYQYFILNQPGLTTDHATHRRWAEVVMALERLGDAPIEEIQLLKTIGLLNIIGAQGGLKASKEIIALCGNGNEKTINHTLDSLQEKSIITYRKYNSEYRVWQGSDFDLEASVQEQKAQMTGAQLAEILNDKKPLQPVVARRYGIETGTLRYFRPIFIDRFNTTQIVSTDEPTLYLCLSETGEDEALFERCLNTLKCSLTVGAIVGSSETVKESLLEVIALQRVQHSSPELASDPIAQRELKDRLSVAIRNERKAISGIMEEPSQSTWQWGTRRYEVNNKRAFQELLTIVLKNNYTKTPHLHNELINREKPSSSAIAGRKKLLLAMLEMESTEDLGIEKFPPEKAIYRSILRATGLHTKTNQGWQFTVPGPQVASDRGIQPLWQAIENFLDRTEQDPLSIFQLYQELLNPPYGIKSGLLPVLFLAAYLVYKEEIVLYEDGYYSPFLTQELLEKILKSPELFSIQRLRIDHLRDQLFTKYAEAITLDDHADINMIAVLKPLSRFMVNLPDYTKRTKRVSEKAQKVREHFFAAKSPTLLLFKELPIACGFKPIGAETTIEVLEEFSRELKLVFSELRIAYHSLLSEFRLLLKNSFNENEKISLSELRERLRGRYGPLQAYTIDTHGLKAFLGRLADHHGDDGHWLNSLATFIARKPPEKWLDEDINIADYRLVELSKRLRDLERLRIHYEDSAQSSKNSQIEVVMLRTVRQGGNDHDVIISLDESKKKAVSEKLDSIQRVMKDLPSEDLRLALLAQLFEEYIVDQKNRDNDLSSTIEIGAGNER
ncbi:hypothetical protein [Nitrosomonas ureae]|uniref:Uncharacterized protein n=1 Tax=Nitrosomonas ureae TaxID=44577 RepID=A0A1H2GFT2_9PROT|nr:hypothetical protein [Nitrosomonas ureae]ALQ51113.1 hypothetical protein ATY38_07665 [Nitrosomonas ureae]SDU18278.1 hypothetical protein SAMN05216406_13117 [Nitrosomonas ureae]